MVADNRAYDYSRRAYQNTAPLPQQPAPKPVSKPRKKAKPKLHILSITFVFLVSIFIISRYAYIAEINFSIVQLESDYKAALKTNTELNVKLAKSVNLETLEKTAIEKLHMQYPDPSNQVIYVAAAAPSAPQTDSSDKYYRKSDVQENKYIASAKNAIGNVMRLLD